MNPGMEMLKGATDCHVHASPHISDRTVTVFEAVRDAADADMRAIGLMDQFSNSAGLAALAMRELGHLDVEVFGGIILEPEAGGLSTRVVNTALDIGYGPATGARFVSLPVHHTKYMAENEGRSSAYIENCLAIPERGSMPDPLPEIFNLVAENDILLNTGHLSGPEAIRVVEEARSCGVERILVPASYYTVDEVREIVDLGAYVEFSFYVMSHVTQIGPTAFDTENRSYPPVTFESVAEKIKAVGPEQTVLSSDAGKYVLPPPVEALREFLIMIESYDISREAIHTMVSENPAHLFKVGEGLSKESGGVQ